MSSQSFGLWDQLFAQQRKALHDAVIVHIHGGGFVAMSSRSHQGYTRKWANALGVPIFSIDYSLAPQHPYPAALDDVWQAYLWIINFAPLYFSKPRTSEPFQ